MTIYENEFPYLFEEIVTQDCYRLKTIPFSPDVIFDIGANVGVFTSYARFLFPDAEIVSIEPDIRNWELFMQHTRHLPKIQPLHIALGTGPIWHLPVEEICAPYFNGGSRFVTEGQVGFPSEYVRANYLASWTRFASLDVLAKQFSKLGQKTLCKIDIEGGEHCIFDHDQSMLALSRMDYIAMEFHFEADSTGPVYEPDKPTIRQSLMKLADTHECELDPERHFFWATRRVTS